MHVKREIYTENEKKGGKTKFEGSFFSAVLAKI